MISGIKRNEFNDNTEENVFLKTFRRATSKDMLNSDAILMHEKKNSYRYC